MELATRYDPHEFEGPIYQRWLDANAFTPDETSEAEPFVIMIPPPNVTGALHMGHALNGTLQDIVIRYQRMNGKDALWLPGTDHAGIATQAVVEKKLFAETGQTRQDLGREAFLAKVWEWKEEYGSRILEQFKRLGSSCDWTRTRFTFEEHMSRAVRVAFVRLWEKGLIYRGARLVNWDCVLETAVSDDEVEMTPKKGQLAFLRYPIDGEPGRHIVVATTRPETMLGDTGVAVHPEDERYGDLVGKFVRLPFVDRKIPIVADDTVEREFGTGAVKITPAHDEADYERGQRHNLPMLNILNKDGTLNDEGGPFAGMARENARKEVLKQLEELELLEKVEDHPHNVPVSDRSKSIIEPLLSEQWFVKMKPLAEPAIAAVKNGSLEFKPARWTKVYLDWLENVHDWCISRQLWWGHRIPVWYDEDGVPTASTEDLEIGSAHPQTGKPIVRQDEDVLDTWASSWLWPFATIGWPDKTADLARFYPGDFLSTASEIIYLWVARMVMAGYELLDHLPTEERCPFKTVYIHATVMDAKGKRMSKSAGNGIDPIDMIEQYGADAVRFSLVLLTREGQDVKLSEDRFEMGRRFTNKVWNASRFVFGQLGGARLDVEVNKPEALEDRWILSRFAKTAATIGEQLTAYKFNDAANEAYRFVWNDLCDWFLELSKSRLGEADGASAEAARGTLAYVLNGTLRLLHPFLPFQTEVLWQALHEALGIESPAMLVSSAWPTAPAALADADAERDIELLQGLVGAVRSIRALTTIGDRKPLEAIVRVPDDADRAILETTAERAKALGYLASLDIAADAERPPASAVGVSSGFEVFVPLGEDVDLGKLAETIERRVKKTQGGLRGVEGKLKNEGFLKKADPEVVEAERARRDELQRELALLEANLAGLQ